MGQQKGNPTPSVQNQAYETLRPNTNARENRDYGTKPVMIDDTKTLDELIDSGSQLFTQGYAKDTDLIDGTINARFDTLTANEYHITILSSSVLYANGSNKFGDSADDRHEFTGSILVGGDVLGNARLNQATASLNTYTGSNDSVVARILQTTASLNTYTGSLRSEVNLIEAYTASLKGAAIVSSSQQITNYYKFAETASANTTFYGGVTANSGLINGTTDAFFDLNRSASGNASRVRFQTIGTDEFEIGLKGGVPGFHITKGDATELVTVLSDGGVDFVGSPTASIFKIKTAGGGIDFSVTSNGSGTTTSELLNDYEEGTWTPSFAGTGGQSSQVYGSQDGTYTKVGRLVTFTARVSLTTLGTITGFVRIDGLPFTPQAVPGTRPATTFATNTTFTGLPVSDVYGGNAFMYLYKVTQTNPTTATQLSQGDLTATTNWQVNGFYYTA